MWCFCFIYGTFHLIFNRKQEINQLLKSLRDIWKGVHFLFAVALEFYKLHSYFSRILLKLLVCCYNLLENIKTPPFTGVFCRYLSNLNKMKMYWSAFPSFQSLHFLLSTCILSSGNLLLSIRKPLVLQKLLEANVFICHWIIFLQ